MYLSIGCGLAYATERQGLYFNGAEDVPAPVLGTTVEVRVTGIIARAKVTQIFKNPSQEWVEGIYIFPLPEDAAVDTLRMRIGERVIRGVIQDKLAARQTYETAKQEGKKATLIEQQRPDVFTTSVANVGPGETVEVAIELQQVVRYEKGKFGLRFPMVVAPREVTDALPVKRGGAPVNPFSFHADLNPGFPLAKIESPTHAITMEKGKQNRYAVDLKAGVAYADRDLVLEWTPAVGREPRAVYYTEEIDGETYGLLMVMPPDAPGAASSRLARETTFIIDTSGSMEGSSIIQARQALLLALDRLQPSDWFNVIEFNSQAKALFSTSVQAHAAAVHQAMSYVRNLKANGGTYMLPALQSGLKAGGAPSGLVRQVIFATDGQVEDETASLQFLQANLGDRRLFTMAIGSAPNSHFLRKVAEFGRGSFTHIANESEVASRMSALFAQLESPMLHRLEVQWSDAGAEAWPARVPDLYLGEPLVVAAKMKGDGPVTVQGQRGKSTWEDSFPAPAVIKGAGIDKLWARRKIQALEDSLHDGANHLEVHRQVTELGLRHHLVTTWTSLVAVDESPTAPAGVEPIQKVLPVNAPVADPEPAVEEMIVVTAESPVLDQRRISTGATVVSQAELEKIPTARDPYAVLATTPGVLTDRINVGGNESGQQAVLQQCARVLDTLEARAHRAKAESLVKAGKLRKAEAEYIQALVYDSTDEATWRGLEELGRLAGFAVDRQGMARCMDGSVEGVERFIRAVVIVR
ncbi:MAG TPA: VIT domain-containing protein [Thermoanaerobaculia bacterium]|nr:VIT domain-containing protein [Thermoanaerobaculia bacterium]